MTKIITYGQIAYEAYCAATGGKSLVSGTPLPKWDDQDERIRTAWNLAGSAVVDDVLADGLHSDGGSALADPDAVMRESRLFREALENVNSALNRETLTYHERIRDARRHIRAALEGR